MKEKGKGKRNPRDKKKGQAVDGTEKRPVKAKVDELVVSVSDRSSPVENNADVSSSVLAWLVYTGV